MQKVKSRALSAFFGDDRRALVYKTSNDSYFVEMYLGDKLMQKMIAPSELEAEGIAENFVEITSKDGPEFLVD